MNRLLKLGFFTIGFLMLATFASDLLAQCPMCKIAAESNLKDGGTAARGLNNGILYIFVLPYILLVTFGFLWYKNRRVNDEEGSYVHN